MAPDPRRSYYRLLMVDPSADTEIISTVYRKLAQRYHPDLDPSPEAGRRLAELNEAYNTLRNAETRARYDAWYLSRRDRRATDQIIRQPGQVPFGAAGLPVGPAEGSVIDFGRYSGWTLGQIRRHDPDFLEWLVRRPMGRPFRAEIQALLARRS